MSTEIKWHHIKRRCIEINEYRIENYNGIVSILMALAEDIVDQFKADREFHKNSDSRFRYWTYVPSIERGAASAIIRWRRYLGPGKFSDPVPTSKTKDSKLPMSLFLGCTRAEKRAIQKAEERFSLIRKVNDQILNINKSHNALLDLTGARALMKEQETKKEKRNPGGPEADQVMSDEETNNKPFTEKDRLRFRKSIGLDR